MCKELTEELDKGKQAATLLAEHIHRMSAGKATIPVEVEGCKYQVIVKRASLDS